MLMISWIWSGHDTVTAELKKVVSTLDEANVILYASEKHGMYGDFELEIDGGTRCFPYWMNVTNPTYAPRINYDYINEDGKKDLIIVLTRGYGTGVLDSEVHVFNKVQSNKGENYQETLVDNPIAITLKIKTKLTQHEAVVTIDEKIQ
ncbi:hypothetical protein GN156_14865 [bacterium LRH843]|nr:hypothetical protein [bacterium LRH843]